MIELDKNAFFIHMVLLADSRPQQQHRGDLRSKQCTPTTQTGQGWNPAGVPYEGGTLALTSLCLRERGSSMGPPRLQHLQQRLWLCQALRNCSRPEVLVSARRKLEGKSSFHARTFARRENVRHYCAKWLLWRTLSLTIIRIVLRLRLVRLFTRFILFWDISIAIYSITM